MQSYVAMLSTSFSMWITDHMKKKRSSIRDACEWIMNVAHPRSAPNDKS